MPKKVFISYRREDTASAAGRVYDRLAPLLAKSNVFFDVSTLGGGDDVAQRIASEIGNCDAALVFIGEKRFEQAPQGGAPRIFEPNDYVRAELRAALSRKLLLVPVLVGGARHAEARATARGHWGHHHKEALPHRHESFDDDTEYIVAAVLGLSATERAWEEKGSLKAKIDYAIGGAIAAAILVLIGALLHFLLLGRLLSASIGAPLTTLLLIASDRPRVDGPALRNAEAEIALRRTRITPRWARTRSARARHPSA